MQHLPRYDLPMRIEGILTRLAELFETYGPVDYGEFCRGLLVDVKNDPIYAMRMIRTLNGGMGSFYDIFLEHSSTSYLAAENSEVADLRSELYNLCSLPLRPVNHDA